MKVEIEISEEDAATILCDNHWRYPLAEIIQDFAHAEARKFRCAFPKANPVPELRKRIAEGSVVL